MTPEPVNPTPQRAVVLPTIPVSTILVILVALVGGVDLILDGHLSDDFTVYMGIVGGSSGLLAIGRGLDSTSKP